MLILLPASALPATRAESSERASILTPSEAVSNYLGRAEKLRDEALKVGRVSYDQVLTGAYGIVPDDVVRRKAAWRASGAARRILVSDYALSGRSIRIRTTDRFPELPAGGRMIGYYEATSNLIEILDGARSLTLMHEAGHALQNAFLLQTSMTARQREPIEWVLEPAAKAVARSLVTGTKQRQLAYLLKPAEWEVRLQDLNRCFAVLVPGRFILDGEDTVEALLLIGMPLNYAEVSRSFGLMGESLTEERFEVLAGLTSIEPGMLERGFHDAAELLVLRDLVVQSHPSLWERMLGQIIFEAPGHL